MVKESVPGRRGDGTLTAIRCDVPDAHPSTLNAPCPTRILPKPPTSLFRPLSVERPAYWGPDREGLHDAGPVSAHVESGDVRVQPEEQPRPSHELHGGVGRRGPRRTPRSGSWWRPFIPTAAEPNGSATTPASGFRSRKGSSRSWANLLLRGRQQVGELRSRASRMRMPSRSLEDLRRELKGMQGPGVDPDQRTAGPPRRRAGPHVL